MFGHLLLKIQLKAIRTNESRNTTVVTNMRFNKEFRISQLVLAFIPLLPFSEWSTETVLDPEAMKEEGLEETAHPKPVLSELGF